MKTLYSQGNNSCLSDSLITLCFVAFIIIAIDLGSELAVQKEETGTIACVMEECSTEIILISGSITKVERPLLFEIPLFNLFPSDNTSNFSVNDRAPPEIIL